MLTNDERAEYGERAIRAGAPDAPSLTDDEMLTDTLANIMHLCEKTGVRFGSCARIAETHYRAESER